MLGLALRARHQATHQAIHQSTHQARQWTQLDWQSLTQACIIAASITRGVYHVRFK